MGLCYKLPYRLANGHYKAANILRITTNAIAHAITIAGSWMSCFAFIIHLLITFLGNLGLPVVPLQRHTAPMLLKNYN